MSSRLVWVGCVLSALVGACGGDDEPTSPTGGSGSTSAPAGSSTGGDDASAPAVKAAGPKLTEIMKMAGGLHVMWELPERCDGVELERKEPGKDFSVAYELPGTVDNKHDGLATEDTTYTYRARCKVDAGYSDYSNEMSANPR